MTVIKSNIEAYADIAVYEDCSSPEASLSNTALLKIEVRNFLGQGNAITLGINQAADVRDALDDLIQAAHKGKLSKPAIDLHAIVKEHFEGEK